MDVRVQVRCHQCGKLYAQAGYIDGHLRLEILEGISAEQVNRAEKRALMICSCAARTPIDLRLFDGVPHLEPGDPGW